MSKFLIVPIVLLALVSCGESTGDASNQDTTGTDEICVLPAPNRIEELGWMLGSWELTSEGTRTVESWMLDVSGESMTGEAWTVDLSTGDTVFSESLFIHHENSGLVYTPTIADQNEGKSVDFLNVELNEERAVFENPEHDFPQKITYLNLGQDAITAIVSGTYNGESIADTLRMIRVKH